ncbi:MAG: TonB-dependent receptor [Bacteroidota bacterium]
MPNLYSPKQIILFSLGLFILLFSTVTANAQNGAIKGRITTSDGKSAGFVNIGLKETNKGSVTAEDGSYTLNNVKEGAYTLMSTFVGLQTQEKAVTVIKGQTTTVDFVLPESAQQLSEVVVKGNKTVNNTPVSAGKSGIDPMDLPQSITTIGRGVIEDQQASKLSDVIRNVNGVSLGTTRGATSETFFARGYNLGANNIFRNGSRVNTGAIPEASTLEKVEVLKGSAAMLYGNVSGGAVINMVTKQPKFNFGGEVSMRVGSYSFYKPIVDVYGPISKNLAFRVVGTYENAKSYRKSVESNRVYVNPSLLYKISNKTELLVQGDYLDNNFTPDFGIGSLNNSIIPTSIDRSSFFNTPWAYQKVKQATASATINHQINSDWKVNAIASYQQFKRDYFSTERIQADAEGDWKRSLTRSKTAEDYYTGQVNLTGTVKTGRISHTLLVGSDAERYTNSSYTYGYTPSDMPLATKALPSLYDSLNILNPGLYAFRSDEPGTTASTLTETPTYRFGMYAQDLINLSSKLKVLLGLRWSFQEVAQGKTTNLLTNAESDSRTATTKVDRAFSPRVGIVYQPISSTSIFGSYSNNFTINTGTDIYLQPLKPSLVDQYEIGIKNDFLKGRLSANVTFYKIVNSDLAIMARLDQKGNNNSISTIKEFSGQTTSDGFEVDLNGKIAKGLNFLAGYSYTYMRYTKTAGGPGSYYVGERLVSIPTHTANATVFYTCSGSTLPGLKVGFSGFYTGDRNGGWNNTVPVGQPLSYDRQIPVSGFATFDISLGYSYKKIAILGKLSNITNELNYYVHENYSVNPIPPRQFMTTVSYRF